MFSQIQETGERKFEHCVNISTPKSLPLAREREIKEAERRPGLFICSAGLWTHAGGVLAGAENTGASLSAALRPHKGAA